MLSSKLKIASSVVFISTLIGCGGGGSSSSGNSSVGSNTSTDNSEVTQVTTVETEITQDNEVTVMRMADLIASDDFEFTNKEQVDVALDLESELIDISQTGARAYVSIYEQYQVLPSGQFYPDAASRVVAGELQDGQFNQRFTAFNDDSSYLIEVWFYNGEPAMQKVQMLVNNKLTW